MDEEGFEPPNSMRTDLQSASFIHLAYSSLKAQYRYGSYDNIPIFQTRVSVYTLKIIYLSHINSQTRAVIINRTVRMDDYGTYRN